MNKCKILALCALLSTGAMAESDSGEFYRAIRDNRLDALRSLLRAGDVNVRGKFQSTPLHTAAAIGSAQSIRMLVEGGADVNAKTQQGTVPLTIAAYRSGFSPVVRMLLEKGADARSANGMGITALHAASTAGDLESVRLLLDAGADPNAVNRMGNAPLHEALTYKAGDVVRLLIARGANVNTPAGCCGKVRAGHVAFGKLTPLMLAAPFGPREMVALLLEKGADVNAQDVRGMTALMFAAGSETQDAAVVKLLLAHRADPGMKSALAETAQDWAGKFCGPEVAKALGAPRGRPEVRRIRATTVTPREAGERALGLLQKSSAEFFRQSGCFGCHHQGLTSMALHEARARGWRMDGQAASEMRKAVASVENTRVAGMRQLIGGPGAGDHATYFLAMMSALDHQPDALTETVAFYVAAQQKPEGSVRLGAVSRAPMEEGDLHRTALAMKVLKAYLPESRGVELSERMRRAAAWMDAAPAKTTDDWAMKLLGLSWSQSAPRRVEAAGRRLLALQRKDGGWGGNPNLASDAYATGQSLYALLATGMLNPSDAVARRAVRLLLGTQEADGSWHVRSRAPKFQPYFESGFPHGHDQWISSAATAWAVMALARAEETPALSETRDLSAE